jgi:Holliday junction resolvase
MSNIRRAPQRDSNEPEIVAALVKAGASVTRINGTGVPDLLVGYGGQTFLLEVKMPAGDRSGQKRGPAQLNDEQLAWWSTWRGRPPAVVRSPAEALAAIGVTT